ncbi:MAG: TatD family hydrolase [Akkermansiaceae bacterium]|jgi:TatD DNase family protein
MIDAHNHLHDPRLTGQRMELISDMKKAGVTACVVNGTSEEDWPAVATLAQEHPGFVIPSFGLHPWKVAQRSRNWLSHLCEFLSRHPHAPIGECGLDRWMESPDLQAQHEVFRAQLNLAAELDRPLTIHCLKAWGPLLTELREAKTLPRFLLHSFGGSQETANELLNLGAHFSFSGYFLHPPKEKVRALFASLPPHRILVESDAPDMAPPQPEFPLDDLNHPANLPFVARKLSEITRLPEATFSDNAKHFFSPAIA